MDIHSPLQEISFRGYTYQVKRDDLIDPFVSGNKWRKLEHHLRDMATIGKDHLVTFGGAYSNHLLASAALCARKKIRVTGYVRGEDVSNPILFYCKLFGMELIFVSRENYNDKQAIFKANHASDPAAYFVDEGGAGASGEKGCAAIAQELPQDTRHILCASGTGTTALGIMQGLIQAEHPAHLHVVPVLKNDGILADFKRRFSSYTNWTVHEGFHFGGYGKTNPELFKFIRSFVAGTGLVIDPVYTGKMFYALHELLAQGIFTSADKIIAVHTGGVLGALGYQDKMV